QAAVYREGRKTRNSRDARAMERGSKQGKRAQDEQRYNAEVEALYKLAAAGVRAPTPLGFYDGVLIMELITDADGDVAPRLCEVAFSEADALRDHAQLIREVVRMLCVGLVHGDLSEYNILMDAQGPVVIDLPQAVDAASNPHAREMLTRDINNLRDFYGQFAPSLLQTRYALEIWQHYADGILTPDSVLTGEAEEDLHDADVGGVLQEIEDVKREETARLARLNPVEKTIPDEDDFDPAEYGSFRD
ncbi:MAG: RIO1 family regulatory kinase/ATPase, partial [Flavobacteriales bacterium]